MSGHDEHKSFNANRIFWYLLALTLGEVVYGLAGAANHLHFSKPVLWGGLLVFALFKGLLIASYFMHLRFEGWIVKGLLVPTPFLIAVILAAISPDVSRNELLDHEIGSSLDVDSGRVVPLTDVQKHALGQDAAHGEAQAAADSPAH
jgi:cytochrome c oxidase subunit IV